MRRDALVHNWESLASNPPRNTLAAIPMRIAGRSQLRLTTFFATYAPRGSGGCVAHVRFGCPLTRRCPPAPVRSMLRVCIPRRRD